jgi:hypothetical protein
MEKSPLAVKTVIFSLLVLQFASSALAGLFSYSYAVSPENPQVGDKVDIDLVLYVGSLPTDQSGDSLYKYQFDTFLKQTASSDFSLGEQNMAFVTSLNGITDFDLYLSSWSLNPASSYACTSSTLSQDTVLKEWSPEEVYHCGVYLPDVCQYTSSVLVTDIYNTSLNNVANRWTSDLAYKHVHYSVEEYAYHEKYGPFDSCGTWCIDYSREIDYVDIVHYNYTEGDWKCDKVFVRTDYEWGRAISTSTSAQGCSVSRSFSLTIPEEVDVATCSCKKSQDGTIECSTNRYGINETNANEVYSSNFVNNESAACLKKKYNSSQGLHLGITYYKPVLFDTFEEEMRLYETEKIGQRGYIQIPLNGPIEDPDEVDTIIPMNETVNFTDNQTIPPVNDTNLTVPPVNDTNVTVPPVNDTNITVPPINDTNVTVPPVNDTNVTVPPTNDTVEDPYGCNSQKRYCVYEFLKCLKSNAPCRGDRTCLYKQKTCVVDLLRCIFERKQCRKQNRWAELFEFAQEKMHAREKTCRFGHDDDDCEDDD